METDETQYFAKFGAAARLGRHLPGSRGQNRDVARVAHTCRFVACVRPSVIEFPQRHGFYMHGNPVKRGLVTSPDQSRWSSFRFYYFSTRRTSPWTRCPESHGRVLQTPQECLKPLIGPGHGPLAVEPIAECLKPLIARG